MTALMAGELPGAGIVIRGADGQPATTTLAIAAGTEVQHEAVIKLVRKHMPALSEFGEVRFEIRLNQQGSNTEFATLNEPQSSLLIAFMRNSDIVVAFKIALVRGFYEMRAALATRSMAVPDFSSPAAAARAWADQFEATQAAVALASHATATKAEIGHRREATAMNTASQAVKKVSALQIELDQSKQYASVKRMEMLYHGQKFDWRKLKGAAQEMDMPAIDIFDANYGTVKAYHVDVWREVYALSIDAALEQSA